MNKFVSIIFFYLISVFFLKTGSCGILDGDDYKKAAFLLSGPRAFSHYCVPCHGDTGRGDGRYFPTDLEPKPANISELVKDKQMTREYLRKWITGGSASLGKSNLCPAWSNTLPSETVELITVYILPLSEEKTIEKESRDKASELQQHLVQRGVSVWLWCILGIEILVASLMMKRMLKLRHD